MRFRGTYIEKRPQRNMNESLLSVTEMFVLRSKRETLHSRCMAIGTEKSLAIASTTIYQKIMVYVEVAARTLNGALLAVAVWMWSYAVEHAVVRCRQPALRLSAVLVIALWSLTACFHLLTAYHLFHLWTANLVWGLLILAACLFFAKPAEIWRTITHDATWIRRTITVPRQGLARMIVPFVSSLALLRVVRSIWLPPLAWDALTYHAVKAGLYVQQGHTGLFATHGGWGEHYRWLFGGGEALFAWAMLPFHGDFVAGLLDAGFWATLPVVLYALGRSLGARATRSWAIAIYCASLPACCVTAGALYTDNVLLCVFLTALVFSIQYEIRRKPAFLWLALLAVGVAAGIKILIWPMAAVTVLWLGIRSLHRAQRPASIGFLLAGSIGVLVTTTPWLLLNWGESGFVLGSIPCHLGPWQLGKASPATSLLLHELERSPQHARWVRSLAEAIFRAPWTPGVHLSVFSVPFAFLGCLAFCRRRFSFYAAVKWFFVAVLVAGVAALFFTHMRLLWRDWGPTSSRFLLPIFVPLLLVGVLPPPLGCLKSTCGHFIEDVLWIGATLHLAAHAFYGWSIYEFKGLALILILALVAATAATGLGKFVFAKSSFFSAVLKMATVLILVAVPAARFRDKHRYKLMAESTVIHEVPRDISLAARAIDRPSHPFRIAVTAGTWPDEDNWMLYHFLGSKLQNTLVYTSTTRDGSIIDLPPLGRDDPRLDVTRWLARIRNGRVDAVMAFWPEPIEVRWMEERPECFERLDGRYPQWGLYWVRASPNATFWRSY